MRMHTLMHALLARACEMFHKTQLINLLYSYILTFNVEFNYYVTYLHYLEQLNRREKLLFCEFYDAMNMIKVKNTAGSNYGFFHGFSMAS